MTVINMISFGREGVAVADEQASTTLRKYNVVQKLHVLENAFVYGGGGPADCVKELYDMVSRNLSDTKKARGNIQLSEVSRLTEGLLMQYKNQLKDRFLNMNLAISLEDLLTGVLVRVGGRALDESAKSAGRNICSSVSDEAGIGILLGGIEDARFDIYTIDTIYAGRKVSRPHCSIGTGADESDKVLSGFVAGLPRDKREAIDKYQGLVKIIEATNASSNLNVGVGGSPSIVYISTDEVIIPDENQCVLVSELVEGLTRELLERDFVYDAVARVVYSGENFEKVEEEMKLKSKDWKKLDRLLRGYKE